MAKLMGALALAAMAATLSSCGVAQRQSRAIFVLVDVSGTYYGQRDTALRASKLMAVSLMPGDRFTAAQIGSCSFDDDAIFTNVRLPDRPSTAAARKREVLASLDAYAAKAQRAEYTDIRGAMLQAAAQLGQSDRARRVIVIFSDLVEDPAPGCASASAPLDLAGVTVVAANVIKLKADAREPAQYFARLGAWKQMVEAAGGQWRHVEDVEDVRAVALGG